MNNSNNNDQSYISKRTLKAFDTEREEGEYIFASYSHKDADEVMPELERFHDEGYNIWYDEGIFGGTKWKEYIGKNLIGSSLFVVFISPNSMASDNVKTEIAIAKDAGIPIIPIFLEFIELDLDMKYDLILYQGILRFEMTEEQYDANWKRSFERYVSKALNFVEQEQIAEEEPVAEEPKPLEKQYGFRYLDELIHSGEIKINLDFDILFDEMDDADYGEGISLDLNGIVINANNHTIDAKGLSRIFNVTAENVTIKNLQLNGGHAHNTSGEKHESGGGAIYVDVNASLNLFKCTFSDNYSESDGGALFNKGDCMLKSCVFNSNSCKTSGGAISNFNSMSLYQSRFKDNESVNGGAIYNYYDSNLTLADCKLRNNRGLMFAGAIYNYSNLKIDDVTFKGNVSEIGGGAILNYGVADISGATFRKNSSNFGGAVFNMSLNKLNIYSYDSSNFENREGSLLMKTCSFGNNDAANFGGAICNLSNCKMIKCVMGNNSAGILGNLISNGPEGILNPMDDVELENQYVSIVNISEGDVTIRDVLVENAIFNQKNCLLKVSRNMKVNSIIQDSTSNIFLNNGKLDFY